MKPKTPIWQPFFSHSRGEQSRERLFVLIGTYNHESFISQAIEGALKQEVDLPFQILVRDDASTDKTADIVLKYATEHPDRIIPVLYKESQRQLGRGRGWSNDLFLRAAKMVHFVSREKVYVALCEGDDYWTDPTKLQKQVNFLREHPTAAIVHHGFNVVTMEGGNSEYEAALRNHLVRFEPHPLLRNGSDLLEGNFIMTCTVMMRLSGWNPKERASRPRGVLGDWVSFVVASEGRDIGFIDYVMSTYRLHEGGIHSSRDSESSREIAARTVALISNRQARTLK